MFNRKNKCVFLKWNRIITYSTMIGICLMMSVPSILGEEFINLKVQDTNINDPSFSLEKLYIEEDSHYEYGAFTAELFPNLCYVLLNIAGEMSTEEEDDIDATLLSIDTVFLNEINGFAESLGITDKQAVYLFLHGFNTPELYSGSFF